MRDTAAWLAGAIFAVHACSSDDGTETPEPQPIPGASVASASSTTGAGELGAGIGAPCDEDIDCATGSRCIRATDRFPLFDGGPPAGYCSPDCSTDADCGPGARCVDDAGVRACFLMCTLGVPPLLSFDQWLDPLKCRGREDMACDAIRWPLLELTPPESFCNPSCSSHQQCPIGRFCNFHSGKCVEDEPTGSDMGEACTVHQDCQGDCADFNTVAFCTRSCVHGGTIAHHWWECGGLDEGLCTISFGSYGAGDLGYCIPGCTKQSDCLNPLMWCITVPGINKGYCFETPACPNGQAACDSFPGSVCTDTPHGPYCIGPRYPLDGG